MGAAIMRIRRLAVVLLFVPLTACGESVPSTESAREAMASEHSGLGSLEEFTRSDGANHGENGYVVMFRAGVRLKDGFSWAPALSNSLVSRSQCNAFLKCTAIPEGSLYVVQREILYRKMERGRRMVDWSRKRYGYCSGDDAKQSIAACGKVIGWKD
jgi:hypothetical protein